MKSWDERKRRKEKVWRERFFFLYTDLENDHQRGRKWEKEFGKLRKLESGEERQMKRRKGKVRSERILSHRHLKMKMKEDSSWKRRIWKVEERKRKRRSESCKKRKRKRRKGKVRRERILSYTQTSKWSPERSRVRKEEFGKSWGKGKEKEGKVRKERMKRPLQTVGEETPTEKARRLVSEKLWEKGIKRKIREF